MDPISVLSKHNRQRLQTAQPDIVAPFDRLSGQVQAWEPAQQRAERDLPFEPGQSRAEAEMRADGEGEVAIRLPGEVKAVRVGELLGVAIRRAAPEVELVPALNRLPTEFQIDLRHA